MKVSIQKYKNGKNIKKLAAGDSPVIVGEKILYVGGKIVKERDVEQFSSDGIYSMSLSGTGKKKVSNQNTYKIGVCGFDTKANCGTGKAYLINYKGKKILLKKWYLVG